MSGVIDQLNQSARRVGHCSSDSIRAIICWLSRTNGGYIFRCESRVGYRFSTDFCTHHEG